MTQAPTLPFIPFARPTIDEQTIAAVGDVMRSGWLTGNGQKLRDFESRLADYFGGRPVRFANPADAQRNRVSMVYQEFGLVPTLSVTENIFLGRLPTRFGRIDWPRARGLIAAAASAYVNSLHRTRKKIGSTVSASAPPMSLDLM